MSAGWEAYRNVSAFRKEIYFCAERLTGFCKTAGVLPVVARRQHALAIEADWHARPIVRARHCSEIGQAPDYPAHLTQSQSGPVEKPLINVCQAETQFDVVIRTAALNGERLGGNVAMVETRSAPRFRVAKPANIEDGGFKIACIIRDLSLTGAAVEVTDLDTKTIPATFTLIVPEDKLKLPCRVVWRTAFRIGLTFT